MPYPLPPDNPPLQLDEALASRLHGAQQALSRLDLAGDMEPSIDWFIYAFVRKEAVLSSQIEGTQATLVDLFSFEAEPDVAPVNADVKDICNYLDALAFARRQLTDPAGLPLTLRLLCDTHHPLMHGVRGADKQPGEIRCSQNWIGDTRPGNAAFVPPPPHLLAQALSDFERYIHSVDTLPALVRVGLLHVQLETLHPFLDGNGRVGRLLITLLLEHWGLLSRPLLYLSLFLKRHRQEYYSRLNAVRRKGDWEGWLAFFLEGVETIASEASTTARDLFTLVSQDRGIALARADVTVLSPRLLELLPQHPVITPLTVIKLLDTTRPTAGKTIALLESAGILVEATGRKRDRTFHYARYLEKLKEGTELV